MTKLEKAFLVLLKDMKRTVDVNIDWSGSDISTVISGKHLKTVMDLLKRNEQSVAKRCARTE